MIVNDVFFQNIKHERSWNDIDSEASLIRNSCARMLLWRSKCSRGPLRRMKMHAEHDAKSSNGVISKNVLFPFYTTLDDRELQEICRHTVYNDARDEAIKQFSTRGFKAMLDFFYGYVPEGEEGFFPNSEEAAEYRFKVEERIPVNLIAMVFMAMSADIYIDREKMVGNVIDHKKISCPYMTCGHTNSRYYYLPVCPDKCKICWDWIFCEKTCYADKKLLPSTVLDYYGGDKSKMVKEQKGCFGFEEQHARYCSVRTARARGRREFSPENINYDDGEIGAQLIVEVPDAINPSKIIKERKFEIRKPLLLWNKFDYGLSGPSRGSKGLPPPCLSDSYYPHKISCHALQTK